MDKKHNDNRCEGCIIRQLNSLNTLSKDDLSKISDVKKEVHFNKGEQVFIEGQKLKGIYCIKSGNTKLSKISDNGNSHIVKVAGKGELLGKRSLISEGSTNLDAVALTDLEMCFIPKEKFVELINKKSFNDSIIKNMANELLRADNEIVNLAQKSVIQRLSHVLIYLSDKFGNDSEGFISIYLKRNEIADLIGTSKEGCIRMLSSFKKKKLIEIKGKKIKLLNKDSLYKIDVGLIKI